MIAEYRLITDTAELAETCARLAQADFITVDTEFLREKTYYPKLCLVQLAGPDGAYVVDPLAPGIDLAPLLTLLDNPVVPKVFHASRQDLEIFHQLGGRLPAAVFDTQVAAQVLGFGESVSYSELASKLLNIQLDKGMRFTDWSKRPLGERQLAYAADDVIHLREIFTIMLQRLKQSGRDAWIEDDMHDLLDESIYATSPQDAWRRIKYGNLKPQQLIVLKEIAAWRETEAQRRDVPRGRLLKDETLVQIAHIMPRDMEALLHTRGIDRNAAKVNHAILAAVHHGLSLPREDWPTLPARKSPPAFVADAIALLQQLLQKQCRDQSVLPRLVATRDELEQFAQGDTGVRFLQGWRHAMFGEMAQDLMAGKIAFQWDPHKQQCVLLHHKALFKVTTGS